MYYCIIFKRNDQIAVRWLWYLSSMPVLLYKVHVWFNNIVDCSYFRELSLFRCKKQEKFYICWKEITSLLLSSSLSCSVLNVYQLTCHIDMCVKRSSLAISTLYEWLNTSSQPLCPITTISNVNRPLNRSTSRGLRRAAKGTKSPHVLVLKVEWIVNT